MITIDNFAVKAFSLITSDGLQAVKLYYKSSGAAHLLLSVYRGKERIVSDYPVAIESGDSQTRLLLPCVRCVFKAKFVLCDGTKAIAETVYEWKPPRKWTLYAMVSSHTDLGLHNSHYIQRCNASRLLDEAARLCEQTKDSADGGYRYTVEGTAVWNGYALERGDAQARTLAENHVKAGRIGVCCGVAGNHTQTYGLEEMCRSAYERKRLKEKWGIESETLAMIDNNGLSAAMIQPYAEAGYKNIIFAPNPWNPISSGIWRCDTTKPFYRWNSDADGGGSRIDVRYDSALPMVFDWTDEQNHKITVWASASYLPGGARFGMDTNGTDNLADAEEKTADTLGLLEEKYPYDVWLFACYGDDQVPNRALADTFKRWNEKWAFPKFETLGNPDRPFNRIREKFGDGIPKLYGDITGGWYQHPVSVPELLAQKFGADRLLPTAEKWAVVAALTDCNYRYPAEEFERAWYCLLFNDEHSYGTSEYSGRPVYETWMQHRDWIEKASDIAERELNTAVKAVASKIAAEEPKTVYFNPTLKSRTESVRNGNGYAYVTVPPLGYTALAASEFSADEIRSVSGSTPPVVENGYYRMEFCRNGAIKSIYDKELGRELIKRNCEYRANEPIYTNDNHKTYSVPSEAEFTVTEYSDKTVITSASEHKSLRGRVVGTVTLYKREKRIDIDNKIEHPRDMINDCRYNRYVYYSFPFDVDNCKRYCHLNGTVAEYATDVTGHGTDVYMATREWCCCQNGDFGIALLSLDSQLIEFGNVHPDKTDFGRVGDGSEVFVYAANDWLQKHTSGGSHLEFRFRFCITSYSGDYRAAGVSDLSERFGNPLYAVDIEKQQGVLNGKTHSFLSTDRPVRLLTLKRADDGNGIIARIYGDEENVRFFDGQGKQLGAYRCTVDERDENVSGSGFVTYRLEKELSLPVRRKKAVKRKTDAPSDIGETYTGLIDEPRAACGAESGQLYLLWGKCRDSDLAHYEIYRSETSGFTADESTFVACVSPEPYCVERYEDAGLKHHTEYYYRVRAVNASGIRGKLSNEFSAFTKE